MLKQGQIAETEITGYTADGQGVCRVDGCAVFVPNVVRGELCRVRVTHVGQHSAHGIAEEVLRASQHRIERACPYAKRCGGCRFWHMDYAEERSLKAQRVLDALRRIGGQAIETLPILGADGEFVPCESSQDPAQALPQELFGYRNKAQYQLAVRKGEPVCGFYRAGTHEVEPVTRCRILPEISDRAAQLVLHWAKAQNASVYDERTGKGLLRHVFVRVGVKSGQVMVCLVANGTKLPAQEQLVRLLQEGVEGLASVVLAVNKRPGNVILGDKYITLYGEDAIEDELCGLRFRLSPRSFYQVNHDQAERLYEKAVAAAGLTGTETVLDLYCGTGTITLVMARRAGRAIGVELVEQAIADAKENARRNGIENAAFFCADAGEAAKRLAQEGTRPDVIVVDPPRKGLSTDVIGAIAQMAPQRVVYVSCDPATLARDVKLLAERGYRLQSAEAVDMFPRTAHVETVVSLSQLKSEV